MGLRERIAETWSAVLDFSYVDFEVEIRQEKIAIADKLYEEFLSEADYDLDDNAYVFCGTPLEDIVLRYTSDEDILCEILEIVEERQGNY